MPQDLFSRGLWFKAADGPCKIQRTLSDQRSVRCQSPSIQAYCVMKIVSLLAHWLLNGISNVWYESNLFQDSLEELKLVVRGSLIQVASLQDCFLQQSEPLATTNTGVCALAVCSSPSITPRPVMGRVLFPKGGLSAGQSYRVCLQKSGFCAQVQGKRYLHRTCICITHRNLD